MRRKVYNLVFLGLAALYIVLTTGLPSDPEALQRYNISQHQLHLLALTVAIPIVLIWLMALYGFNRFHEYALAVRKSREGRSLNYLATGLMVLIFSLPLLSSLSSMFTYYSRQRPDLLPTLTILKNYLNLLFPFIAFLLIAKGADSLLKTLKSQKVAFAPRFSLVGIIALSCIYTWLITTRPIDTTGNASYYLPNVLILFSLAIPYLFMWCKGLMAAYQLYVYKTKVRGNIYREALNSLAAGLSTIIVLSIFLQLLFTLSSRLTSLSLGPLLYLVYILVALTAVSYGLIARGAKKLKKIEEV